VRSVRKYYRDVPLYNIDILYCYYYSVFPPMKNDKQLAHRRHDIVSWTLSSSRSVTGRTWCIIYKLRRGWRRRRPPYELFYFWCCLQGRRKRETMTVWLPILSRSITLTLSLYLSVTHFMYTILHILFHYPISNHVGGANRDSIRTLLYSFIPV